MNLPYTSNLPNPPDDPADDVGGMQINAGSIGTWVGIDHIGFQNINGGYHNDIHFVTQGSDPAVVSGFGQLYTKTITPTGGSADQQLFYESGVDQGMGFGVITQLTGANSSSAKFKGYTWLPGSILLQWGYQNVSFGTPTHSFTNFNIPFPNTCFVVIGTPYFDGAPAYPNGNGTVSIYSTNSPQPTTTNFTWNVYTSASSGSNYTGFYWLAIGN